MGVVSSIAFGFLAGFCSVAALRVVQRRRSRERRQKAADLAALGRATPEDLRKLFPEGLFPSWVSFPEYEHVHWLNTELRELWPYLNKAISAVIRASVEPVLEHYRPPVFASLKFQKLTLGTVAPFVGGVKMLPCGDDEVVMQIPFKWIGNPSCILAVQTIVGVSLPVQVKDVAFHGVFRIALKPLMPQLPCFGAMVLSLHDKPSLDFTLKVVGGDIKALPGISSTIDGLIRTAVTDSLLYPARIVIPLIPGDYKDLELRAVGQLEVKIVAAKSLLNKDLIGKSDPFVILYVRPIPSRMCRTSVQKNNLNPIWNESFSLVVEDKSAQNLVITVMDDDGVGQSEFLGMARLALDDLQPCAPVDTWLPLHKDSPPSGSDDEERGSIHIEILYRTLDEDGRPVGSVPGAPPSSAGTVLEREMGIARRPTVSQEIPYLRGVLVVTVIRGEELVVRDLNGTSDPFVQLQMKNGGPKKKTKMVPKTLNPEWNQTIEFLVEDATHDMLVAEVWDHDIFFKDFMGRAVFTLTKLLQVGEYEETFTLTDVPCGRLILRLRWKPLQ
eukprot:SM000006S19480  [mRNA]  locus=s6:1060114:1063979:+ [translate_table: standard]